MTTTPTLADGRPGAPELELELAEITWRRIQVLLRLRPARALDPATLRLRHVSSGASVPATGWDVEGDDLVVRLNVMQGPGQMPLGTGRWVFEAAPPSRRGGRGTPLRVAASVDAAPSAKAFELVGRTYTVRPFLAGTDAADTAGTDDAPTGTASRPRSSLGFDVDLRRGSNRIPGPRIGIRRRVVGFVAVRVFAVGYWLARRLARRNGRRILFTSDSRAELGGNLKLVHDRMVERGLDREFELQTLFKPGIATRRSLLDRLRLPWWLARADVIVIDDFQPVIQRLGTGDARIVQLWHAVGAFKTVGYSRVGKPGAPNPYGRVHKNYTLVTVSSTADVPVYAEAFGIAERNVVPTGIPRVDPMFDPVHRDRSLELVRRLFPETEGRRTWLFAPTFRGFGARTATYDLRNLDWERLYAVCVEQDAVCLVRMHPFVRAPLRIPDRLRDRLLDGSTTAIEPNDLLFAADLLITDYSSIVYEYSTLDRPMLFYAYDLDDYVADRDFYEPYRTFVPGRIVRTFDELLDAIRREDFERDKVGPFARRHFDHLDGGSTDRVIDLITVP